MAVAASGKPDGRLGAYLRVGAFVFTYIRLHLANLLTILRLIAVMPVTWALLSGYYITAIAIFALAALSDALDGWYAKRTQTCTNLGALLDPLADKVLMTTVLLVLAIHGILPFWFAFLVLIREVLMGLGYLWLRYRDQSWSNVRPSIFGKSATALEFTLITLALTHLAADTGLEWWIVQLSIATSVGLILATLHYGLRLLWPPMVKHEGLVGGKTTASQT